MPTKPGPVLTGEELKACPFCGEREPLLLEPEDRDGNYDPHGNLMCEGCGATGPIRDAAGQRADARERWNTRAQPPSLGSAKEIARELLASEYEKIGVGSTDYFARSIRTLPEASFNLETRAALRAIEAALLRGGEDGVEGLRELSEKVPRHWRVNPDTPSVLITEAGRISVSWTVQRAGESSDYSLAEDTAAFIVACVNHVRQALRVAK